MKTVKLTSAEVDIKTSLTFGDSVKITKALDKATTDSIIEAQYTIAEIAVIEIREGEEKKKYSRAWHDALSKEDGEALCLEVNSLVEASKKKED